MRKWERLAVGVFAALISAAVAEPTRATVKGDRVNLRARPAKEAEVVGQVGSGDALTVLSQEGEWIEVTAPERVDVWVHRDFVRDGVVQTASLQVRSGPGINYHRVGVLKKGDKVQVRGEFGEWLKIAPPPAVSLWVHRDYIQLAAPAKATPTEKETAPTVASAAPSTPPAPPTPSPPPPRPAPRPPAAVESRPVAPPPPPPPPPELRLADAPHQGRLVQREGVVRPVGYLFGRPSRFQLVVERMNRPETLCYLYGNDEQLAGFQNRRLAVEGREYWIQGARQPIVVIERIRLLDR